MKREPVTIDQGGMEPWERQPGENEKAFAAFRIYRDLKEKRSMQAATVAYRSSQGLKGRQMSDTLYRWANQFNWVSRARAYDLHLDREATEAARREVREMAQMHAIVARNMLGYAVEDLEYWREPVPQTQVALAEEALRPKLRKRMDYQEIRKWVEIGMRMERLSREMPEQTSAVGIVDLRDAAALEKLSPEERRTIWQELVGEGPTGPEEATPERLALVSELEKAISASGQD